jgi:hypothetical protein
VLAKPDFRFSPIFGFRRFPDSADFRIPPIFAFHRFPVSAGFADSRFPPDPLPQSRPWALQPAASYEGLNNGRNVADIASAAAAQPPGIVDETWNRSTPSRRAKPDPGRWRRMNVPSRICAPFYAMAVQSRTNLR